MGVQSSEIESSMSMTNGFLIMRLIFELLNLRSYNTCRGPWLPNVCELLVNAYIVYILNLYISLNAQRRK